MISLKYIAPLAALVLAAGCTKRTAPPKAEDTPLTVNEVGAGDSVFVLLHGWGAKGDDLVPLGQRWSQSLPMRFVMPAAPLERKMGGREWFSLRRGGTDADRQPQILAARKKLVALIDGIVASGVPRDRIWLGGFSQGAMMSLDFAANAPPVAGYVLLSGRLLPTDGFDRVKDVPIFVSHGRRDRILEFDKGEAIKAKLEAAGAKVTWVPFDGGHAIPPPVIGGVVEFLRPYVLPARDR